MSAFETSQERDVAYSAMGRQIDPSWWTNRAIFHSSQCSLRAWYVLSWLWDDASKRSLAANWKE